MIEVIPFLPEHLDMIEVRPELLKEIEIIRKRNLGPYLAQFPSLTIKDGSRIIACFGGIYLWPHTAESWLRTVQDVYRYKEILVDQIGRLTDFAFNAWNLNRLQTTVQKDWPVARRFAERLGYIQEAELPYYIGETTYLMYAKFRGN